MPPEAVGRQCATRIRVADLALDPRGTGDTVRVRAAVNLTLH